MAKYERYKRIDDAIQTADNGGSWQRWRYGRRVLCDGNMTTPRGYLKHEGPEFPDGRLAWLIRRSGVSAREIQWRIQVARAYPYESQIRAACTDFKTWWELVRSGFPPYPAEDGERPYNPLETDELERQHAAEARRRTDEEMHSGGLFPVEQLIPRDAFPDSTPLPEIDRYADQEVELAARHTESARRLRFYVDGLIKVMGAGWVNATLGEAERAFHDSDD